MTPSAPYQVIARRYRPQLFTDVVGQRAVVEMLHNEIKEGRVGHGYLFNGPRGTGKTSMARIFAKALNCAHGPTTTPCGECSHCLEIAAGNHLDVIEVDAATYTKVENMRDLLEGLQRSPFTGRHKVYIIDEVHMLSNSSFNALLKSLEEPPAHVVFILCTTNPEKIPETVVSRCRRCNFDRIPMTDMKGNLKAILDREGVEMPAEEEAGILSAIALASDGGLRDAQVLLDQLISLSGKELHLDTVRSLLGVVESDLFHQLLGSLADRRTADALVLVGNLVDHGRDLQRFAKMFLGYLRDVMILKAGGDRSLARIVDPTADGFGELMERVSMPFLLNIIQQFLDLEERMRGAAPPRFLLEFTLIKLTAIDPRLVIDPERAPGGGGNGAPPPQPGGQGASTGARRPAAGQASPPKAAVADTSSPEQQSRMATALLNEAAPELPAEPQIEAIPTTDADRWVAMRDLIREENRAMASVLDHGRLREVYGSKITIELAPSDSMMRNSLERPENQTIMRNAARRVWNANMMIRLEVGVAEPEMVGEKSSATPAYQPESIGYDDDDSARMMVAEASTAGPDGALSLEEARAMYPDFDAACAMIEEAFNVKPFRFLGRKLEQRRA